MTRRTMLLGTMAFGALGRAWGGEATASAEVEANCGNAGVDAGMMGSILPPRGVVVALFPAFACCGLTAAEASALHFWFEDERGRATPADVESFPNVPGFLCPVVDFRWSPRTPLEGGRTYRLMMQRPGAQPLLVDLPSLGSQLRVVGRWTLPAPRALHVTNVLLTEGGLGGDCAFPRRELRIRVEAREPMDGVPNPRTFTGYQVFEVRIARYPGKVDYHAPPQFLAPLVGGGMVLRNEGAELPTRVTGAEGSNGQGAGQRVGERGSGPPSSRWRRSEFRRFPPVVHDPAIYLDLLRRGDRHSSFLPRYACTIGLREFDAAGNLGPPFELYVPAAPEVPGLPEEAWLPFGR